MATNFDAVKKISDPKNRNEGRPWVTFFRRAGVSQALLFLTSFLFPGPSEQDCGKNNLLITFPCKPILGTPKVPKEEKIPEQYIPIGMITRNKDVDLIGGKLVGGCTCGMKNGLEGHCRRLSCQNNPGCNMIPPRCWPQIKEPPPRPPPPPDQPMICLPLQLVYCDPESEK